MRLPRPHRTLLELGIPARHLGRRQHGVYGIESTGPGTFVLRLCGGTQASGPPEWFAQTERLEAAFAAARSITVTPQRLVFLDEDGAPLLEYAPDSTAMGDLHKPDDNTVATWVLVDPGAVTAQSTEVTIAVTRLGCAGGATGPVRTPLVTLSPFTRS